MTAALKLSLVGDRLVGIGLLGYLFKCNVFRVESLVDADEGRRPIAS